MTHLLKNARATQKFFGPCGLTSDPHCVSESAKWSKLTKFYTISPAYMVGQTLVHMDQKILNLHELHMDQKNFEFT